MPLSRRRLIVTAIALALASIQPGVMAEQSTEATWPATVVRLEDLRPLTVFELRFPRSVPRGRVTGPAVLRAHITADGVVARTVLLESSGNAALDEASIHAMRAMRFEPHTIGGGPVEVTLVAPVHVPARWGRSR